MQVPIVGGTVECGVEDGSLHRQLSSDASQSRTKRAFMTVVESGDISGVYRVAVHIWIVLIDRLVTAIVQSLLPAPTNTALRTSFSDQPDRRRELC